MKRKGIFKKTALSCLTLAAMLSLAFAVSCGEEGGASSSSGSGAEQESGVTIVLDQKSLTLDLNESRSLQATVTGTQESVVWSTDNASVATVDSNGTVTGVSNGTARVYATIGLDRVSCLVTVSEGLRGVVTLSLDYSSVSLYQGYALSLTASLKNGSETLSIDEDALVWTSANEAVATVSDGVVTGVKAGGTSVTAKYAYEGTDYTVSVPVTVQDLASYTATAEKSFLTTSVTYGGKANAVDTQTAIVVTKITPAGESTVNDLSAFTFTSSDEEIAKIVDGNVVAGSKAGTATITMEDEAATGSFTVEVKTALSSKFDLDMLALAYARGVNETAWGAEASYVLTNDIDYAGAAFLPIAADMGHNYQRRFIGKQWETLLADGNEYGLSFADFVKTGLNGVPEGLVSTTQKVTCFQGTIDGQGYSISNANLMLDASMFWVTATGPVVRYATQLIGMTGETAVIKNLAVENLGLQQFSEAGLTASTEYEVYEVGAMVGTDARVTVKTNGYYNSNSFGVFACCAGTMENLYIELNEAVPTSHLSGDGLISSLFGRWIGTGTVRDCVFIDNYKDNETTDRESAIEVTKEVSVTLDNLILVTNNTTMTGTGANGAYAVKTVGTGKFIGTAGTDYVVVTVAKTDAGSASVKEIVGAAIEASGYSTDGFDGEYWDTTGALPVLK